MRATVLLPNPVGIKTDGVKDVKHCVVKLVHSVTGHDAIMSEDQFNEVCDESFHTQDNAGS